MDPSSTSAPPPAPLPRRRGPSPGLLLALGCAGFLLLSVVGVGVLLALGSGTHRVADATVLKMKVGELPEFVREAPLLDVFKDAPVTVKEHLDNLEKAAKDDRVKGVLLELDGTTAGWAKVEELRAALLEFKKSGKWVVAYSEGMTEREYALALAADEIVMPRDAYFEFNGLATEVSHYPGLLEKLGIEVQYFRYGKYKSVSGESQGRKALTEPVKEMVQQNLALVFEHFVAAVAEARKLEVDEVRALVDQGRLKSDWAKEERLIDTLAYFDEVEASLKARMELREDEELRFVSAGRYREVKPSDIGLTQGRDVIALIYSVGLIVAGKGGDDTQGSAPIIKALRRAVEDERVKAIVFRVDSPGGAGLGCDYVRREVERARRKKPVVVSMSDVAASGGYWVAMDASAIVAQPTTATGSIGIFSLVPSLEGLYDKLSLNNEVFKAGAHADVTNFSRRMTAEEARRFDDDLLGSYQRFVELAAKGRQRPVDELEAVAQGRTWYGSEALTKGLVDELGGFPAAVALAKAKASLPASTPVKVEVFDRQTTFLEELLHARDGEEGEGADLAQVLLGKLVAASGLGPLLQRVPGALPLARSVLAGETTFPLAEVQVDFR